MAVPKKIINLGEQMKVLYGATDRPPRDTHSPISSPAGKSYLKATQILLQLHKRNS